MNHSDSEKGKTEQKDPASDMGFPIYDGGIPDPHLYSCGYREAVELPDGKNSPFRMRIITQTNAEEFLAYGVKLCKEGYVRTFENRIDGNLYASYSSDGGKRIYTYYLTEDGNSGTVKLIDDSDNLSPEEFCYSAPESEKSEFYFFNLNSRSEDTFLIHASDNSWIFIDGGMCNFRETDPEKKFADSLFSFMWERSHLKETEKLVISCWYLTHSHRDHFLAAQALFERYGDRIDLQRMVSNVPDYAVVNYGSNQTEFVRCMEQVRRFYPNLAYLKAHSGMNIQIADVRFTVLYTQEDHLDFWVSNREEFERNWKDFRSMNPTGQNYEIYRQCNKLYDFNHTSLNSIVTVGNLKILELGDGFRWKVLMKPYYSDETLQSDIVKVAHHLFNQETYDYYDSMQADYFLVNNIHCKWERTRSGCRMLKGSPTVIYGFRKCGGKTQKEEIAADYSWLLTQKAEDTK